MQEQGLHLGCCGGALEGGVKERLIQAEHLQRVQDDHEKEDA